MKHVSILVPRGQMSVVQIAGTHQILNQVNDFLLGMDRDRLFDVHLVGLDQPTKQDSGFFSVFPDSLIDEVSRTDLIIIPATHDDPDMVIFRNAECIPWIQTMHRGGAEVASYCVGAYLLGATGLLDKRKASTHWMHAEDLRRRYPAIDVVDDRILTDDTGIYTSGGAYSAMNLLLYIIEKYAGTEASVLTSKAFMIDRDRNSQTPFRIFQGQKDHSDEAVKMVQERIESSPATPWTVGNLAQAAAMSRRTLERRFKTATGNSVAQYVNRARIEAAKQQLEQPRASVAQTMDSLGYSDPKAFRRLFKQVTGLNPSAYVKKFGKLRDTTD